MRYTAHRLKWRYQIAGQINARKPDKTVFMRGWVKRIWRFEGTTIIANPKTLEVWVRMRRYKNPEKMFFNGWSIADKAARAFSKYAGIAITAIEDKHPAGLSAAHVVIETEALNPYLKPQDGKAPLIGLNYDKSHPRKPEFTGEYSAEGILGADWVFLKLQSEMGEARAQLALLNARGEAHSQLLTDLIRTLRKA
jgi:hypothetical protein